MITMKARVMGLDRHVLAASVAVAGNQPAMNKWISPLLGGLVCRFTEDAIVLAWWVVR